MTTKTFTHAGRLYGDARSGGRRPLVKLRLTPSGSHWVDGSGNRYRASNGWGTGDWPMWSLDIASVQPLPTQVG